MNLGIKSILKHSIKYTGASTFVALLSIPKNIILAIVLTPSDFGFFSALWLFAEWAYLLGPGFLNSSVREFNYHFGKNEFKKADAIEREGNGADLIYTFLFAF